MTETIRYALGESSLGSFVAAMSARGLVAFEFVDPGPAAALALRERFAGAELVEDKAGLQPVLEKLARLAEHPGDDPGLPLDPRGTDYQIRVWEALRSVPAGRTTSYGEIAARLGAPREAREVGEACAANTIAILIPCHRVVKKDGSLSGYRWGFRRKRQLIAREQATTAFQLV